MPNNLPRRVLPVKDVLFQPLDDEAVLLHMHTEQYYSFDKVGMRMWELFNTHQDVDTVIERLLSVYDVEEARLRQDLADWIAKLTAAELVTTEA